MREVYRFRGYVISGSLDFILLKPFSALFRSLFGGVDILDLPLSIVSGAAVVWLLPQVMSDPLLIIGYVLLICAGLCLATALHICVLSCGLLILEVENLILIYRDLTNMARIPISAYADPLRTILTYVIPIGIMMSFPVEFILGVLSVEYIPFVLLWCVACLIAAQRLWKYALSRYTSAA
jgi:ABC-2 type transport system permease protein